MKILFLIILIVWSVVRAVQKAQREQKRRLNVSGPQGPMDDSYRVAAPEPELADRESIRYFDQTETEMPLSYESGVGKQSKIYEYEPALSDPLPIPDAYTQPAALAQRRINIDSLSLRTFFVAREVLGTPRSRSPYRPRVRQ